MKDEQIGVGRRERKVQGGVDLYSQLVKAHFTVQVNTEYTVETKNIEYIDKKTWNHDKCCGGAGTY